MTKHKGLQTHDETKLLPEGPEEYDRENSTENNAYPRAYGPNTTLACNRSVSSASVYYGKVSWPLFLHGVSMRYVSFCPN